MYSTNFCVVPRATAVDERALRRLARLDGRRPLSGPALSGERGGSPAARRSLTDGRLISDPFQRTAV